MWRHVVDKQQKQNNRYKFRMMSFGLATGVLITGSVLSYFDKASEFGSIAMAIMTFAGAIFVADYATKVDTD